MSAFCTKRHGAEAHGRLAQGHRLAPKTMKEIDEATDKPDAKLLKLCGQWHEADAETDAAFRKMGGAPRGKSHEAGDREATRLHKQCKKLFERIMTIELADLRALAAQAKIARL